MPHRIDRSEPARGLRVGTKTMARRSLSSGLLREVALRHRRVVGTKNTLARTRPRLGQDRDRGDAASGAHGFDLKLLNKRSVVSVPETTLRKMTIRAQQFAFGEEPAPILGMLRQNSMQSFGGKQRLTFDLGDDGAQRIEVLFGLE